MTPFIFATFPIEIVRLVFEASVTPGLRAADEQQRQRTAYVYCFISKDVRDWVEPLLYKGVVLDSRKQVMSFFRATKNKPMQFLAHAVKTVWIDEYPYDSFDQLHILFSRCILLKRLKIIESELSIDILRNIPKPFIGPYALQELTIVDARLLTPRILDLPHLTLQKLHIINCSTVFLIVLFRRALGNKGLLDTLRLIPQIYLDFTTIPSIKTSALIKCRAIPLWINSSPESISVLNI